MPSAEFGSGRSASFRCRSVAAAGDLLFFASPKKPKEKKGDPGSCVGLLGSDANFAAVQSTAPSGEPQARRIWTLTPKTPTCGARKKRGPASTHPAQTIAVPEPLFPALLGASTRVGERGNSGSGSGTRADGWFSTRQRHGPLRVLQNFYNFSKKPYIRCRTNILAVFERIRCSG